MGKKVTIGGNRVGSGKKMKAELYNYFRSTHNLSEKWASTMGVGILYPALCKLAMRGDSFDIGMNLDVRTIPTKGPLFGTFKAQLDVYQVPIRLYQGILHNNPLAIGLNMAQVKFPQLKIKSNVKGYYEGAEMANNSLLKYLGFSGIGTNVAGINGHEDVITRSINALPALMYYDIFKTYYANKQEEKGYVITTEDQEATIRTLGTTYEGFVSGQKVTLTYGEEYVYEINEQGDLILRVYYENLDKIPDSEEFITLQVVGKTTEATYANITYTYGDIRNWTIRNGQNISGAWIDGTANTNEIVFRIKNIFTEAIEITHTIEAYQDEFEEVKELVLQDFNISNIDDMRYDLLSHNRLGQTFVIGAGEDEEGQYMPYSVLYEQEETYGRSKNCYKLNGLVLKTYQNDIFNNWLNTEWIEGENDVNELTKVAVVDGKFSMDAISFATKLYNMLNRIAVSGGTYEDWQDVVYEEVKRKQIESPIYCGGMSKEVVFDEIVQTAPTTINGDAQALGTLGGRGRASQNQTGGKVHIKCDEACFIIAIMSLTPRQYVSQGNEFYMTDVESLDDLHKPAMDGIGFQDLIGERMAWFDTAMNGSTILSRSKIGKLPAWIEYMTSVDKAYGEFANVESEAGYMILNRNYEKTGTGSGIKDATTYVDPSKYNYAFAYTKLDAQNFWCEIDFDIKARRLMSARLIPHV